MIYTKKKSIGIISGKGGVGKTCLAASLASLAKSDAELYAIILDCDVDAPNLALILPPESENKINSKDTFATLKATFIEEKCVQCKQCYEQHFCEFNALNWNEEKQLPIINYLACEGCGACKVLCPEHAFEINSVKSGEIISYMAKLGFPLIYGRTRLGSTTSGKLVSDVKEFSQNLEEFTRSNALIIDGPPGIGCPVIATVSGLDFIITMTEPTPSGLHDLKRAIEVVQQFGIPFGIVINKYDIESPFQEQFKKYIEDTAHEVLGRIPFDLAIPRSMSFAESVIDYEPNSKSSLAIKELYSKLKKILWHNN